MALRCTRTSNVLVNPDYTRVIARIVSAVAPYPEAREAVIAVDRRASLRD
jgi:hypothetical protein